MQRCRTSSEPALAAGAPVPSAPVRGSGGFRPIGSREHGPAQVLEPENGCRHCVERPNDGCRSLIGGPETLRASAIDRETKGYT